MPDFAAYVFYVNRPDLLQRAVASFPYLQDELTLVDNSAEGQHVSVQGATTFRPPVPLTYSQSMNWMLKDAREKKVDFILHFHSDASSQNPYAVSQLLTFVRELRDTNRRWGCAWSYYDILWAINPKAMSDVGGWDTNLPNYFTDNDTRRRLELAGWECIDTGIQGIGHEGSATINADPKLKFVNGIMFPLYRRYYTAKWGGGPGKEVYKFPFDNSEFQNLE